MGDGLAAATGEVVALAIKAACAALQVQLATLHEKCTHLEAEMETVARLRERVAVVEAVPPVPGPPGPPGVDGLGAEALVVTQDPADDRLLTLGFKRADTVIPFGTVRLRTPHYCGTYERERIYEPGDQVTHAGALWHCHATTRSRPGEASDGWQLQVKRGEGR